MQATSTPKLADQQPAVLVALAAIALAVGIALGVALPGIDLNFGSTGAVAAPDTSYNVVEDIRSQYGAAPDTSYDVAEGNRAAAFGTSATAPVITERGLIAAQRHQAALKAHDIQMSKGRWWGSAPSSTVAGTPVSQADPNDRYGGGVR
jgi:hypothetical protein